MKVKQEYTFRVDVRDMLYVLPRTDSTVFLRAHNNDNEEGVSFSVVLEVCEEHIKAVEELLVALREQYAFNAASVPKRKRSVAE